MLSLFKKRLIRLSALSGRELAEKCNEGHDDCCRLIFERHCKRVGFFVQRYFLMQGYVIGKSEVEDIVQDIFLKVFNNLKKFRGESTLKTWIYRIAINHCYDISASPQWRKQKQTCSLDGDIDPDHTHVHSDPPENLQKVVLQKEETHVVRHAVSRLSPKLSNTLALYLEGLKYDEIAAILGVSNGTVASRIHNAKSEIKKMLKPYYKENES